MSIVFSLYASKYTCAIFITRIWEVWDILNAVIFKAVQLNWYPYITVLYWFCVYLIYVLQGKEYYICNFTPDKSKFPPLIPSGRYMLELQANYNDTDLWNIRGTGEIFRSILKKQMQVELLIYSYTYIQFVQHLL